HDQDDPVGEGPRGPEGIGDQWTPAQRVKHLGLPRAHALAFARSENDSGHLIHRVPIILPPDPESQSGFPPNSRPRRPLPGVSKMLQQTLDPFRNRRGASDHFPENWM